MLCIADNFPRKTVQSLWWVSEVEKNLNNHTKSKQYVLIQTLQGHLVDSTIFKTITMYQNQEIYYKGTMAVIWQNSMRNKTNELKQAILVTFPRVKVESASHWLIFFFNKNFQKV